MHCLKAGKSPLVDNISELLKNGGAVTTTVLTVICKKIWETKWWTQSFAIPLPKKGNRKQCQNCRTTSLVSHPSKIMLLVIVNRLTTKAEDLLAEEQAGFRPGRITVEQIISSLVIIESHPEHQRKLFQNLTKQKLQTVIHLLTHYLLFHLTFILT